MSGRPSNPNWASPAYTVNTWATTASYPAGSNSWNSQPTKVLPPSAAQGFTPDQGAAAEYFNWIYNDQYTAIGNAKTYSQTLHDAAQGDVLNWANWMGQLPALNFQKITATLFSGTVSTPTSRVQFCVATRTWFWGGAYTNGGTDFTALQRTTDLATWPGANEIALAQQSSLNGTPNFWVNPSGDIVYPGDNIAGTGQISEYHAGTWTLHATALAAYLAHPDVSYTPTPALWCVAGRNGSTVNVYTSPDRVTWTARTAPTGLPTDSSVQVTLGTDGAGTLIMQLFSPTVGEIGFSKSTDGGVTWSALQTFTYTPSVPTLLRPVWTGTQWIAMAPNAGARTTKIYTSPDGGTWTLLQTLSTVAIWSFDVLGVLVVAYCNAPALTPIVFSVDGGNTWNASDNTLALDSVCAGAGRFVGANAAGNVVRVSLATGMGVGAVT